MTRPSLSLLILATLMPLALAEERTQASRLIDQEITAALAQQKISPAPRAEQVELVRRLYLDVLGRIPIWSEVESYLADPAEDKHHRLINSLLTNQEMSVYWASLLDHWLCGSVAERSFGRDAFLQYLEDNLRSNRPWNELARELLAPNVAQEAQRGAAYFLAVRIRGDAGERLDNLTTAVATGLFGVQIQCAKCHDHPFVDEIKQDHYYGLAAFLNRTQEAKFKNLPLVGEKAEGEVKFVTTRKEERTAQPMFLDGFTLAEPARPNDRNQWYEKGENGLPDRPYFSRRAALAEHAISPDSPYFKKAIVNRVWKELMGRGLVEPVDQMHAANPATHPELLAKLSNDFAAGGFNLRQLIAGILHSDAYLRSSRWTGSGDRPEPTQYAVAALKPLTAEQFVTSVGMATGHYAQFQAKLEKDKQSRKIEVVTPAVTRRHYARDREFQEFAARFPPAGEPFEASSSQALLLTYHGSMTKFFKPGQGNLAERLLKAKPDQGGIEDAFRAVLSRPATEDELSSAAAYLAVDSPSRAELCSELVWALVCSTEFRFNR